MRNRILPVWIVPVAILFSCAHQAAAEQLKVGLAKVNVTPTKPIRLSGYAGRNAPFTGVRDELHARAMVIAPLESAQRTRSVVLVSIDSILVTSVFTVEIANWLHTEYQIPRHQLVLASTHSHAAPHISGGLRNLYREPLSDQEARLTREYTEQLSEKVKESIQIAFNNLTPAKLSIAESSADFAINRRVIRSGAWDGFGETPEGPIDRQIRLLRVVSDEGKLLGGSFQYACHCTTLGGDFSEVSGDWAGLAASRLESIYASAVFLPIIGCGADANPNPRGSYDLALQHSAQIVDGFKTTVEQGQWTSIEQLPVSQFGYAGIAPEQPTAARMEQLAASQRSNDRAWVTHMQAVQKSMGRLPETYPMPIHTWQFGEELTWIFLGGEVVVDYQHQLEKEFPSARTWVAAYCDDVFAYVASEAMRSEGGYEVDSSMIYYLQPGRWEAGTQSRILRRTVEISNGILTEAGPLTPAQALASIRVPDDFQVELVAAEPLVQDPVNVAFGSDGRVWVVEMSDYPLGTPGGGRVRWLRDQDSDGRLDESRVFLSGLNYPTSVYPWRDGVIVIAAPDILFARDTDGDGKADEQEVLLSGIHEANPQHRASGFQPGLDGWLHFGAGDGASELESSINGKTYQVQHNDLAWNPSTGEIRANTGTTQFVRSRDDFGNWFGNSNSRPIYHYVVEQRYLEGRSIPGGARQDLLLPAIAPTVLPRSSTVDRFNDLFARDRFTSACSSIIARVPGAGPAFERTGFVCEPVHNLVARIQLTESGPSFSAQRHDDDQQFDFFTSTDPWSRPVRIVNAPDGSLWVLDMVRKVIEHPQWIPTAWQERLDLRAGEGLGRIYRVYHRDFHPTSLPNLENSAASILPALASQHGPVRDLAVQRLMESEGRPLEREVRRISREHALPAVRASALGCLLAKDWLETQDLVAALQDSDPRVVRIALQFTERHAQSSSELQTALQRVPTEDRGAAVDLQWILTSSKLAQAKSEPGLKLIAARHGSSSWINRALALTPDGDVAFAVAEGMMTSLDDQPSPSPGVFRTVESSLRQLWGRVSKEKRNALAEDRLDTMLAQEQAAFSPSGLLFLSLLADSGQEELNEIKALPQVIGQARARLLDSSVPEQERLILVNLIGSRLVSADQGLTDAAAILKDSDNQNLQQGVIESVRRLDSDRVPALLIDHWKSLSNRQRTSACATLLTRRPWVEALISALEENVIPPHELDPASVQLLRGYRDRQLRARCMIVLGKPTPRTEVVTRYLNEMPRTASVDANPKLFKEHCAACHESQNNRPLIGPPLENLKHWTLEQWVTSILDPNRNLEPKYRQESVLTVDGQVFAGAVIERTSKSIELAQTDGTVRRISVADIEEINRSAISLMPEGFESKLTPQQLAELLRFVRSR